MLGTRTHMKAGQVSRWRWNHSRPSRDAAEAVSPRLRRAYSGCASLAWRAAFWQPGRLVRMHAYPMHKQLVHLDV